MTGEPHHRLWAQTRRNSCLSTLEHHHHIPRIPRITPWYLVWNCLCGGTIRRQELARMVYDQQISILLVRIVSFQRVTKPERTSSTTGLVQNGCLTLAMTFSFQSLKKTMVESRRKPAMRLPCNQRPRESQLRHSSRRKMMTRGQIEGILVRLMTQLCMFPLACDLELANVS